MICRLSVSLLGHRREEHSWQRTSLCKGPGGIREHDPLGNRYGERLKNKGYVGGENLINCDKDLALYPRNHEKPLEVSGKGWVIGSDLSL